MNYWQGYMNWPVKKGWKCETCSEYSGMTWGMPHAVCRCNVCHAQYTMRPDGDIVDVPVPMMKDEYKDAAKNGWKMYKKPISEWDDQMWDDAGMKASTT